MNNEGLFPQLVGAHYAALYRFALSLSRVPADAADLTQQTFLIWARKGHELRDATKAKTWLFTTLYREFLHTHRRGLIFVSMEDAPGTYLAPSTTGIDVIRKMDAELMMDALQDVDLVFREALTLFYVQELSCLEIAEVLAVPAGTVGSRIYRGKKQLRALLQQKAQGSEVGAPQLAAKP